MNSGVGEDWRDAAPSPAEEMEYGCDAHYPPRPDCRRCRRASSLYRGYYNPDTPAADRLRAAMRALHEAGVQPTGRAAAQRAGTYWNADMGLNGRDGITFALYMDELGYVKGDNGRWKKP